MAAGVDDVQWSWDLTQVVSWFESHSHASRLDRQPVRHLKYGGSIVSWENGVVMMQQNCLITGRQAVRLLPGGLLSQQHALAPWKALEVCYQGFQAIWYQSCCRAPVARHNDCNLLSRSTSLSAFCTPPIPACSRVL